MNNTFWGFDTIKITRGGGVLLQAKKTLPGNRDNHTEGNQSQSLEETMPEAGQYDLSY